MAKDEVGYSFLFGRDFPTLCIVIPKGRIIAKDTEWFPEEYGEHDIAGHLYRHPENELNFPKELFL